MQRLSNSIRKLNYSLIASILALLIGIILTANGIRLHIYEPRQMYTPVFVQNNCKLRIIKGKAIYQRDAKRHQYKNDNLEIGDFIIIDKFSKVEIIEDNNVIKSIETYEEPRYYLIKKLCDCDYQKNTIKDDKN
ncbi:TPA: hypothetical protein ENX78_05475 [Candidatus Poribacteria bacterium]|nr:hypothetical protein [Candidatus Poribacteria bacterium]